MRIQNAGIKASNIRRSNVQHTGRRKNIGASHLRNYKPTNCKIDQVCGLMSFSSQIAPRFGLKIT